MPSKCKRRPMQSRIGPHASPSWPRHKCSAWRRDLLCRQRVGRSCVGIRRGLLRRHDLRHRPVRRYPPRSLPRRGARCVCAGACVRGCECELVCVFGYAGEAVRVRARDRARARVCTGRFWGSRLAVSSFENPSQYLSREIDREIVAAVSDPSCHCATRTVACCLLRVARSASMLHAAVVCCLLHVASLSTVAHLSSCAKGTSKTLRYNFATFACSSCDTCRWMHRH